MCTKSIHQSSLMKTGGDKIGLRKTLKSHMPSTVHPPFLGTLELWSPSECPWSLV